MKGYKEIYNLLHTIYRAANSASNTKNLISALLKIIQGEFLTSYCAIILSYPNKYPFIKMTLRNGRSCNFQKGSKRIFSKKEEEVFNTGKIYFSKRTVIAPLIFINTLGVVTLRKSASSKRGFEKLEKKVLNILIEELSLVLRNSQLYEEHKRTILATVKSLTQFLNRYSPSSIIHTKYLQKILKELAKKMPLTENQLIALEYATLLHDTGKIEIPQKLLTKNAPLSKEELEIIKRHPKKGVELLKNLQALRPVIPIILYHHEKYDGTGYPSGLKKKQIPLEARIMAVIDAFDAMFFGRPYKKSLSLEECIKELEMNKGKQFDPQIVDMFINILNTRKIKNYLKRKGKKV